MATEAHYGEMWAQDAAAMYGYAASSAAASTLAPFIPPTQTTNPTGLAGQSAAVAHAAGTSAVTHAHTVASHLLTSLVPQTLQGLAQPLQSSSTSGLSSTVLDAGTSLASSGASGAIAPASAISGLTGMTGKVAAKGAGEGAGAATGLGGLSGLLGGGSSATTELAGLGSDAAGLGTDAGGLGADFFGVGLDFLGADSLFETEGLAPVDGLGALGLVPAGGSGQPVPPGGTGAAAGVGHAASVGALSVPQSWANIPARSITPAGATAFPSANLGATPAMPVSSSGMPRTSPPTLMGRVADSAKFGYRATVVPHSSVAG
jgi:PPE-repeat protein